MKRSVTVKSDEPATLNENIYAGWIKVPFAPFDITIAEGTRLLRLDDRDQVMLSAGPHDIRFENRAFGFAETRHIEVQPGVTTPLSLAAPHTTLTLTTSAPAELLIDGVNVGKTPLIDYPVQSRHARRAGEERGRRPASVDRGDGRSRLWSRSISRNLNGSRFTVHVHGSGSRFGLTTHLAQLVNREP